VNRDIKAKVQSDVMVNSTLLMKEAPQEASYYKKAVLPQGNRAMLQVSFSVEVRQQHSLQV